MNARAVSVLLLFLLVVIHAQLWMGRGSVQEVRAMTNLLQQQKAKNDTAKAANERLAAEVRDLQDGLEMVEEKARKDLGMVKPNEVFVQFVQK
jgi:cell division protein FtsB